MKTFILVLLFYLLFGQSVEAGYIELNNLINQQRKIKLISSPNLDQIAYCRAKYISQGHWTHTDHEICFHKYGIKWNYGEILAQGYYSDKDIVKTWLNSPSHKSVMLGRWRYIGSSKVGDITVVVFN